MGGGVHGVGGGVRACRDQWGKSQYTSNMHVKKQFSCSNHYLATII